MDFTREPIIETVITPRDGFRLVVRSSKSVGQEEYFVDALEVVSFGNNCFYRSLEKPKAFLVPALDYEVLEVREARIVLKNVGLDRSIKIGGGKEPAPKTPREAEAIAEPEELAGEMAEEAMPVEAQPTPRPETKGERKRDRRRHYRRRRGKEEQAVSEEAELLEKAELGEGEEKIAIAPPKAGAEQPSQELQESITAASSILSSLLTPPPMLISETLKKYRENILFKNAFYEKPAIEEETEKEPTEEYPLPPIESLTENRFEENIQSPEPPLKD